MKNYKETVEDIKSILCGIDSIEVDRTGVEWGWWPTVEGAEFGEEKLKELLRYIKKAFYAKHKT